MYMPFNCFWVQIALMSLLLHQHIQIPNLTQKIGEDFQKLKKIVKFSLG